MRSHALGRWLLMGGFSTLLGSLAAAEPPADPWTLVPALPTGCYSEQDEFSAQVDQAIETLQNETDRQNEINTEVKNREEDPMETARRMQEFMMNNPEEAMKMMQAVQATGTEEGQAAMLATLEKNAQQDKALDDLVARYDAAYGAALDPIYEKRHSLSFKETETQADRDEWAALTRKANAEYEKLCGEWWKSGGRFHAWLASYREYTVEDRIPADEERERIAMAPLAAAGRSMEAYRSTVAMEAVLDYMQRARRIFVQKRLAAPNAEVFARGL